jgi:hypothetical protein
LCLYQHYTVASTPSRKYYALNVRLLAVTFSDNVHAVDPSDLASAYVNDISVFCRSNSINTLKWWVQVYKSNFKVAFDEQLLFLCLLNPVCLSPIDELYILPGLVSKEHPFAICPIY